MPHGRFPETGHYVSCQHYDGESSCADKSVVRSQLALMDFLGAARFSSGEGSSTVNG